MNCFGVALRKPNMTCCLQVSGVVSLEQFFAGIEKRVQGLPEEQRPEMLKRLALAREFVGPQYPLDVKIYTD
jgi:hypothetical protein